MRNTQQLSHKHVVTYYDFKETAVYNKKSGATQNVAYIVQDFITGGELFDYVANSGPFTEPMCRYYFKQMLQGIHFIHSKGFSHRDLKPENILLDKNYDIKIVDFGFACPLEGRDGTGQNRSVIGTPGYMAPEIIARQPYQGQVVDLFALGVILFILYAGHPPFQAAQNEDQYYKLIAMNRSDLFWKAHSQRKEAGFFSDSFKALITCMLQFHPHHRLCIADIIGHEWMLSGDIASAEAVREEFGRRHQINKEKAQQATEEKMHLKANATNATRRAMQNGDKTFLSGALTEEEQAHPEQFIKLVVKDYDESRARNLKFFSSFPPEELFLQIKQRLDENNQDFAISNKTWKLTLTAKREIANPEGESFEEQASIQVEVLRVNDNKFCVDFQRKGGSSILFYDYANKLKDAMELWNNETI